jgi:transcriptional regulator with PAS, ATPase and Fis domain
LAESELFGYEPGAFSGGKREGKIGLFEAAHGGTFFLDEIGELQMAVQAKLLNALEHKRFRRLGGTAEIEVDVRLIAATNRNLAQDVADGRFRKDLLYRLNVFPTDLPPLRERQEDVLPLVDHFLRAFYGTQIPKLSPAATELLLAYTWPGNVRELKNVIEHASILCPSSSEILPAHMGLPGVSSEAEVTLDPNLSHPDEAEASGPPPFSVAIEEAERQILRGALESNNWNVSATARTLGLSRDTLHRKIKKYHFMPES